VRLGEGWAGEALEGGGGGWGEGGEGVNEGQHEWARSSGHSTYNTLGQVWCNSHATFNVMQHWHCLSSLTIGKPGLRINLQLFRAAKKTWSFRV
jgi:hypothetical protein